MKTVRDACSLQPNALNIKLSDQIEQLDELIKTEGDGNAFFEKTHITQGMHDLISEGIARLAGASSQAVFHLKQAMGGGKTHLLVGFGLLAKDLGLRMRYCPSVVHSSTFENANVAAFNGRNSPVHFFWGEIAQQLGNPQLFQEYWTSGPKAPDEKAWLKLFEGSEPVLILLDEMPPYFEDLATRPIGAGTVADIATRAFANLLTAAGKKSNVCIVIRSGVTEKQMTEALQGTDGGCLQENDRNVCRITASRSLCSPTRLEAFGQTWQTSYGLLACKLLRHGMS